MAGITYQVANMPKLEEELTQLRTDAKQWFSDAAATEEAAEGAAAAAELKREVRTLPYRTLPV